MITALLFICCLLVELSPRINTENVIKKIGIGFIMVGALVQMADKSSQFIEIGIIIYLCANLTSAYLTRRKRRLGDNG